MAEAGASKIAKEELRQHFTMAAPPGSQGGKLAQALRGQVSYRQSKVVFADGGDLLHQARINCLLDGKSLVMPSPALKTGFFLLRPYTTPFKDLGQAVSLKGITGHGLSLTHEDLAGLAIDLAITQVVALDSLGARLGDGNGFLDLALAILAEYKALAPGWQLAALIGEQQLYEGELPKDEWDLLLDFAVAVGEEYLFSGRPEEPRVHWPALPQRRIRRLDLLWRLYDKNGAEPL